VCKIWRECIHWWLIYGYFSILPIWLRNAYSRPFWGGFFKGFDPLNVVGYCRNPKRHILAFWCIDHADRSVNATWARAKESKKEKQRKETQRCDKSHICPDHPRCATLTKVVMWGGVPDNYAKFHQNRFRCFGSLRGRNLPFSYAWRYGLYNRLRLPPNCDFSYCRLLNILCLRCSLCQGIYDITLYVVGVKPSVPRSNREPAILNVPLK